MENNLDTLISTKGQLEWDRNKRQKPGITKNNQMKNSQIIQQVFLVLVQQFIRSIF